MISLLAYGLLSLPSCLGADGLTFAVIYTSINLGPCWSAVAAILPRITPQVMMTLMVKRMTEQPVGPVRSLRLVFRLRLPEIIWGVCGRLS